MKILDIIYEYLKEHGFDGLCNPDQECGCGGNIEDLVPCDNLNCQCEPAYRCDNPCDDYEPESLNFYCKNDPKKCDKYKKPETKDEPEIFDCDAILIVPPSKNRKINMKLRGRLDFASTESTKVTDGLTEIADD